MEDLSLANLNPSSAQTEMSRWSDADVPSLSLDDGDDFEENDFYIKEHNDKLEKLRKENFDLKLRLYLLENDGNFANNKELKLKVIKEFDNKDNEVRTLQKLLEKRNKENVELRSKLKRNKALQSEHYAEYVKVNDDLKSRISSAVGIFLNLIDSVEELIQILRNNRSNFMKQSKDDIQNQGNSTENLEELDVEKLSKTLGLLEQASKFIIDNPEHLPDHIDSKKAPEKIQHLREYGKENAMNISQINAQEICAKEFLNIVATFRSLLGDFRSNRMTYRQFSDRMDPLFDEITSQHRIFENLYLDQLQTNKKLRQLQTIVAHKDNEKEKFQQDLGKCISEMDTIIVKAKAVSGMKPVGRDE